ncbi:MAG TPA: ATP-binding protein [Burkholderiaceae bacterium]|nr:ATP-binding protein [Burkholderiaceae bacterium]
MSFLKAKSIRRRLVLIVAIGLLPLVLFGGWGVKEAIESQGEELEHATLELSRALATAVDSELNATVAAVAALARSERLLQRDIAGFYNVARREVTAQPYWAEVTLTNATGQLLFDTSSPYGASDIQTADPKSLQAALETRKPVVGHVIVDRAGISEFAVRQPVFIDGVLTYVLTAAVRPERILEVVNKQQVPPDWIISIFDGANRRVARSKNHQNTLGGAATPSLATLLSGPASEGTGVTKTLEGRDSYTGFTRVEKYGWVVVVGNAKASSKLALARNVAWYVGGIVLSILFCSALALSIGRKITKGIDLMRANAARLGEGQDVWLERTGVKEVDEMGLALEAASRRLQKTTDSLREALDKAAADARMKDEFLGMLGHELRNPLAPMLASLYLMDQKSDALTTRERQIMRRQISHMRRLVDDLLDVSRITHGKLEMKRQPVDIRLIVEHAIEAVRPITQELQQNIELDLEPDPIWVMGDETRLVQAITNLLTNALRFSHRTRVSLTMHATRHHAHVVVQDEGAGMTPETLAHLFEPFYQAPQTLARSTGGLGLGLAIVKSIVDGHGGTVSAHSEGPDRGSRFEIVLPTIAPPTLDESPPRDQASKKTGRVLVVDDNIDALETISDVLRLAGHEVHTASHPHAALTVITRLRPDVAVLDIGLPDMDGYQLATTAKKAAPQWNGKLVALTGYGQDLDKTQALLAGFCMHLSKPADPNALLDAIETLLESAAPRSLMY